MDVKTRGSGEQIQSQTADGGGGGGKMKEGGGGGRSRVVNTVGHETAHTSAGQHLFLLFLLFYFSAFFFLISNTKTMF